MFWGDYKKRVYKTQHPGTRGVLLILFYVQLTYTLPRTPPSHNSWCQNTGFSPFSLRLRRAKATAFTFFFSVPYQGSKEGIRPFCSEAPTPSPKSGWEGTSQLLPPPGCFSFPPQFIFCFPSTSDLWSHFMNCHVPPEPPVKTKTGFPVVLVSASFLFGELLVTCWWRWGGGRCEAVGRALNPHFHISSCAALNKCFHPCES